MEIRWMLALVGAAVACGDASSSPMSEATGSVETPPASSGGAGARAEAGSSAAGRSGAAAAGSTASTGVARAEPRAGTPATSTTSAAGTGAGAAAPSATGGTGGTLSPSGGAGAAAAAEGCSRTLLQTTMDAYFVALAAHDPSTLPLGASVKFTENGEASELGTAGLWTTAGKLEHAHSALDVDECTAVAQAVVPDGSTAIPLAVRLKLEDQKLTEIETIAVRQGDFMLMSNTDALSASADTVHWQDPVPPDQRNTREELTAWMDKYFRIFPRGVCDTSSSCKRIENGGGSFDCSAGASCAASAPGPNDRALVPRLILADVETGVGIGFTMFQANTDVHFFKMFGGEVHGVSAILAKADGSGWD